MFTTNPFSRPGYEPFGNTQGLPKPPPGIGQGTPIAPPQGNAQPSLPAPPPQVRSTNPFSKENRSQTLLDIGAAFLSHDDFFEGLGAAARGVSGRMDELRKPQQRNVTYGGPDSRFEIETMPDGTRQVREVPEFAKVLDAKAAEKARPDPKELVDLRARAIYAINQLPENQRAAAYADFMQNPAKYGGIDTSGMPGQWDQTFANVAGSMGQTVNQAAGGALRQQSFEHRVQQDGIRNARQAAKPVGRSGGGRRAAAKAPAYGSDLDY